MLICRSVASFLCWTLLSLDLSGRASSFVSRGLSFGVCNYAVTRYHGKAKAVTGRTSLSDDDESSATVPLTSALLLISYDGTHFTGWSSANDPMVPTNSTSKKTSNLMNFPPPSSKKRRRARNYPKGSGFVRSVQGVLAFNLAKIYGNVDPRRIIVEGCSRTDKGVHARGMVAQFYCISDTAATALKEEDSSPGRSIPGKRMPHPCNSTDTTCFEPIPLPLSKLAFALNRMCLDIRIMAVAPIPEFNDQLLETTGRRLPFHPTLSSRIKTYQYVFSVGPRHDPTQWRWVWYIGPNLDEEMFRLACNALEGTHDFGAFQGAPRGAEDRKRRLNQNSICSLESVKIEQVTAWRDTVTYVVSVVGDRFLYKMVRFLVGALVAVGTGKLSITDLNAMIDNPDGFKMRQDVNVIECAPAHGLTLHEVAYHTPIQWKEANT